MNQAARIDSVDSALPLDLMSAIRAAYPDATPEQIRDALTPRFLAEAYGPPPSYSTLSTPALQTVKTAAVGSFVICYGYEPGKREPVIALIKRGDKGREGEDRFGVLGGYTDLGAETTAGEQPNEGAVRELMEEARNDHGEPVISPRPDRLKLLASGIDYRNPTLPVQYNGHMLELTARELATLKTHSQKLQEDPDYREAANRHTEGEVADLRILPLSEVLKMQRDSFTHPHEFDTIAQMAKQLQQRAASVRSM